MASVRLPHQHAASAAPDSQRLRRYSQDLYGFILRYRALCDVHVVDLLVRPRGDVVPAAWLDALEVLGERGLTRLASGLEEAKCSWPEDLQVFLRLAAALPLPQVQDCSLSASKEGEADGYSRCRKANDKMNDKKLHEVSRLSELVWRLATEKGIKAVVDAGAGQGYLSRALAYEHGLDVLAVDSDTVQTCGAQKTQARDQSKFRSMLDETADEVGTQAAGRIGSLRHITCHVSTSTIADTLREDLLMLRKPDFAGWNDSSISEQPPKCVHPADYLLTGLHACGNLTPDILRLFATEREAGAVAVVGCCYNFLTEVFDHESSGGTEPTVPGPPGASPSHGHPGFPMSRFGIDCGFRLGVRARQLACQVPMRWESKAEESREAFRRNFFRAALQYIVLNEAHLPKPTDVAPLHVGRLRPHVFKDFETYVGAALRRISVPSSPEAARTPLVAPDSIAEYERKLSPRRLEVAVIWTLRALIGPVIESLIVVDRCLYLMEQAPPRRSVESESESESDAAAAVSVTLLTPFDRIVSPRNFCIVASKVSLPGATTTT